MPVPEDSSTGGAVHALVIGVSDYTYLCHDAPRTRFNLGLKPLSSAARSAFAIAEWLKREGGFAGRPLGQVYLLVAPSAAELGAEPALRDHVDPCTLKAVQQRAAAWRQDLSENPRNFGFFYFAGHGVQRKGGDHVLLLADFGEGFGPVLGNAIDSSDLLGGMAVANEQPDIGRHQLYVFDACRIRATDFVNYRDLKAGALWDAVNTTNAQRSEMRTMTVHTAVDGTRAFAAAGRQSAFSRALLRALEGSAARPNHDDPPTWEVTLTSLQAGVTAELGRMKLQQSAIWNIPSDPLVVHRLRTPPKVTLHVEVEPAAARGVTRVVLIDQNDENEREVAPPWDERPEVPGGQYIARATIDPPTDAYEGRKKIVDCYPPESTVVLNIRKR